MSRPETAPTPTASIDAATTRLDRSLRRLHLDPQDRRSVLEDVRADLGAAAADGAAPETLIGPDPDSFAREAAAASGYQPRRGSYGRVLLGGAVGAVSALVGGYLLISYVIFPFVTSTFDLPGHYPVLGGYVFMSGIALAGALGVLAVLALLLQDRPAGRATLARTALLVPAAAGVGVVLIGDVVMGLDTPPDPQVVGIRALVVALLVAAALVTARVWAARSPGAGRPTDETSTP